MLSVHCSRWRIAPSLLVILLAACRPDTVVAVAEIVHEPLGAVTVAEHEEPSDPREAPSCHGRTATIWYNMPAELIPQGVTIRPVTRGDEPTALATDTGHDGTGGGVVIVGSSRSDVIVGSPARDSIFAANGDDLVCADPVRGGEDAVDHAPGQGGGGPDHVWGGNGNDTVYGGGGPDSLYGGNGNDRLVGGGGPDLLRGEHGDDYLDGGVAPDHLEGGTGNDELHGGGGNDRLSGDAGDDWLFGEAGFDILDGGSGTNRLDAGDQTDTGDDHTHSVATTWTKPVRGMPMRAARVATLSRG